MTQSFWLDGAVQTKPDLTTLSSKGYPTNGDPARGIRATKPGAAWFYLMSLVRASVIEACGQEENPTNEGQFFDCLKSLGWVPEKGIAGAKIADKAITETKLADALLTSLLPPGMMMSFAGGAVPAGWLLCNGSNVSRTTYSRLFSAIGTRWGAGDGSTTFTLPNANGRVIQGTSDLNAVGRYLEAQLPNISGQFSAAGAVAVQDGLGAFAVDGEAIFQAQVREDGLKSPSRMTFNASRCSSVYADSAGLQVPACLTLVAVRY